MAQRHYLPAIKKMAISITPPVRFRQSKQDGTPDWTLIERLLKEWRRTGKLLSGYRSIWMARERKPLTARAHVRFANRIHGRFGVAVTLHDERLQHR
ncbi:Holliday junction resolvase RuvX [Salmonella enterica subsp. enterica]|nr:Holliday junction resolvase RuvX [Salmonella enterica subsp. enterica]